MSTTFNLTDKPLISANGLAENLTQELSKIPEGIVFEGHPNAYHKAIIAELNRFPGWPIFTKIPDGTAREIALANVETRARQWEANVGKPMPLIAGFTPSIYVQNLRALFECLDIEASSWKEENGVRFRTVKITEFSDEDILSFLTDPDVAIAFALDHLEAFEVAEFLSDRRAGKDLKPWLKAWRDNHQAA